MAFKQVFSHINISYEKKMSIVSRAIDTFENLEICGYRSVAFK